MAYLTRDDRQAIVDQVHTHFIVNQQPAGRLNGACCTYNGYDDEQRRVSCAIGIFDTEGRLDHEPMAVPDLCAQEPDVLCDVFGRSELTFSDIGFLTKVQDEHDMAVTNAATSDRDFDSFFIEELAHRLNRFAGEQGLNSPCSPSDLEAG